MSKLSVFLLVAGLVLIASGILRAPIASAGSKGPQMGSAQYQVDWSAVGEISGGRSSSSHYVLQATVGQVTANSSSTSVNYEICTGWECVWSSLSTYLPFIRR